MSAHLDRDKKIQLDEKGNIDFGSAGAGAALASLRKFKVFDIWQKHGIKYVNFADTENVTVRVCDPLALAYLIQSNNDCLADVV